MDLLFRNHRRGILWPFQNIFFSFPLPKTHFSMRRFIQMENCFSFNRDVFSSGQPFYQKTMVGIKPMVGLERHSLFWKGFVQKCVTLPVLSTPWAHAALGWHLLSARHVAQWGRCPVSSPHAAVLPWEALFHCVSCRQRAYVVSQMEQIKSYSFLTLFVLSPCPQAKILATASISFIT